MSSGRPRGDFSTTSLPSLLPHTAAHSRETRSDRVLPTFKALFSTGSAGSGRRGGNAVCQRCSLPRALAGCRSEVKGEPAGWRTRAAAPGQCTRLARDRLPLRIFERDLHQAGDAPNALEGALHCRRRLVRPEAAAASRPGSAGHPGPARPVVPRETSRFLVAGRPTRPADSYLSLPARLRRRAMPWQTSR